MAKEKLLSLPCPRCGAYPVRADLSRVLFIVVHVLLLCLHVSAKGLV